MAHQMGESKREGPRADFQNHAIGWPKGIKWRGDRGEISTNLDVIWDYRV